jgi:DNA mismatch endonuclease (patch repair protein)
MSPEKRSVVMSRIRGKDTGLERAVAAAMAAEGLEWESHARDLPGCPDFVFRQAKVAVFVDGDFWHGWHFPLWRDKLSEKWEAKIEATRRRDERNRRTLRRYSWTTIRIWEHQVAANLDQCVQRVKAAIKR